MLQMKINYIFLKNNLVIDNKTYTLEEIKKNNFNYKVLDKDEIIIKRLCTGKLDKNKKDKKLIVANSNYLEYEIFNLVSLYNNFDFENNVLIVEAS